MTHDQQFESLADTLARRLWRSVVLPGLGLQVMLFMLLSCVLTAALSADDTPGEDPQDEPPTVQAALPDEGQPPAPEQTPAAAAEPPAAEPPAAEPPAAEPPAATPTPPATPDQPSANQPAVEPATAAEVTSNEQLQQAEQAQAPDRAADQPAEAAAVRELSVEPVVETRPILPADRPAWVGAPNETSERVHRLYVASFTANSPEEVEREEMLDEPMVAAVARYLDETAFPGQNAYKLRITSDFIRHNMLDKSTSYVAAMTTQSGTEYQKWVVLQVTPEQRDYFGKQLHELKQRERMSILAICLASGLVLTGLLNMGFNRRRRRYPNAVAPITMAIMPGAGQAAVQQVAAAPMPMAVAQATPKKRSIFSKLLLLMVCAGIVAIVMAPALTVVKVAPEVRWEHIEHGENLDHVIEVHTRRPTIEKVLGDHD